MILHRGVRVKHELRQVKAIVYDVADGDTISVIAYLGCGVWREERVRLKHADADELVGPKAASALLARNQTNADLCGREVTMLLSSDRRDIYGRLVADGILDGATLSARQVAAGRAVARTIKQ